jgi:AmmeMemoRadiSam system protein A
MTLSENDRQILLQTAREAIGAALARRKPAYPPPTPVLDCPCGAFVTLKKRGQLRGCIGHVTASRPLGETVKEVALASAFEDPRFTPLSVEEWPSVRIEISVLSPLEPVTDPGRIVVGVHGIKVRRGPCAGLLLPQVATEQGWDRETFLDHTCLKAGLPSDAWRDPDTSIEVFTATVFGENPRPTQERGR